MSTVFQYIFLVFGIAEVVTNGMYLVTGTAAKFGRKQHAELPPKSADRDVVQKVIRMFILGVAALIVAILSFVLAEPRLLIVAAALMVLFIGYEVVRYRCYWRILCEFILITTLAVLTAVFV